MPAETHELGQAVGADVVAPLCSVLDVPQDQEEATSPDDLIRLEEVVAFAPALVGASGGTTRGT